MLASLEAKNLLSESSELKDLGLVMALYMQMAGSLRAEISILEDSSKEARFDDYILAYANKHAIPLVGPDDIDDIAAACDGTVKLPAATAKKPDPWGAAAAIKKHAKTHGKIGGDKHDIMAMSSFERAAHNFGKKDPLGKKEIEAL